MESGDAEHGVVDAVAFEAAVAKDLPGLHAGEGVLDAGADFAVGVVVFLFPGRRPTSRPRTVEPTVAMSGWCASTRRPAAPGPPTAGPMVVLCAPGPHPLDTER